MPAELASPAGQKGSDREALRARPRRSDLFEGGIEIDVMHDYHTQLRRLFFQLSAFIFLAGISAFAWERMPYHPFRQIGTNHYDLRPLYGWRSLTNRAEIRCPMPEWTVPMPCTVRRILSDGLLLTSLDSKRLVLRGFPLPSEQMAVGKQVMFFALRVGTTNGVDLYEYGKVFRK